MNAFQCDLTRDALVSHVPECSVDIATLVFVLSAIHPDKILAVLQNIIQVRKWRGIHIYMYVLGGGGFTHVGYSRRLDHIIIIIILDPKCPMAQNITPECPMFSYYQCHLVREHVQGISIELYGSCHHFQADFQNMLSFVNNGSVMSFGLPAKKNQTVC